ncbi:RNA-binding protein 42 [Coemansia aciculifera]|uniref:RNA-binding protein 42 n=1 Tax=Coemansia aciculifera TaxID=417176 RepID=A0ACC1M565_9FUNG|nr:RNA-binding protein 42 [Coemansia aciculifera]
MLPSKNRVQAKKILQAPRVVAHSAATVLSAEPVLHKNPIEESQKRATAQPSSSATLESPPTAPYALTQPSIAAGDAPSEQYTYVTDDSGYTWLYDTAYGQYYYYDPAQGTYVPYDTSAGAGLAEPAETSGTLAGTSNDQPENAGKGKHAKKRRIVRMAGGQVWEDSTLDEWPADDYRLFVGDLGPEVTTELLEQVFGKFRTMQKALVVMDKKTGKSRGYGFLSFGDPDEFLAAWKQFNGKYVGSRPISLRKSSWKDRNVDIRKAKRQDSRAFLDYKHGK